jgi:aspartyl aminopeptidase
LASLTRHWFLDWDGPRPESLTIAASEAILQEQEAAVQRRTNEDTDPSGSTLPNDTEAPRDKE